MNSSPREPHWLSQQAVQAVRLQICYGWSTTDKRTQEKRSCECSCYTTVSYSICKENGLLIDTQTGRLMHMHTLKREPIRAHANTHNDISLSAPPLHVEKHTNSAVISVLVSRTAKPYLNMGLPKVE